MHLDEPLLILLINQKPFIKEFLVIFARMIIYMLNFIVKSNVYAQFSGHNVLFKINTN